MCVFFGYLAASAAKYRKNGAAVIKSAASAASPEGLACRLRCMHRFGPPGAKSMHIVGFFEPLIYIFHPSSQGQGWKMFFFQMGCQAVICLWPQIDEQDMWFLQI